MDSGCKSVNAYLLPIMRQYNDLYYCSYYYYYYLVVVFGVSASIGMMTHVTRHHKLSQTLILYTHSTILRHVHRTITPHTTDSNYITDCIIFISR
jgi:hypothetical protein